MKLLDLFRPANGNGTWERRRNQLAAKREELRAKTSVSLTGAFGWDSLGGLVPAAFDAGRVTGEELVTLQRKCALVWACVEETASSIAAAPLEVGRWVEDQWEPADGHPAADMFYKNQDYSYNKLIRLVVQRLQLTGASAFLLAPFAEWRGTGELTALPTQMVRIRSRGPQLVGYRLVQRNEEPKNLAPEDLCLVSYPDPTKFHGWIAPLEAASREYEIDHERESTTLELMRNKNLPGGFISLTKDSPLKTLTPEQAEVVQKSLDERCGRDTARRGKAVVLPFGLQFSQGVDAKDLDFTFISAMSESRICQVFGVPPILVGAKVGLDHGTYANYDSARQSFYKESLKPLWEFIASELTRGIDLGTDELEFRFDLGDIPELEEDINRKAERVTQLFQAKLIQKNEARALLDLPPVEGGDEFQADPPAMSPFGMPPPPPDDEEEKRGAGVEGKARAAIGSFPESGPMESALAGFFRKQRREVYAHVKKHNAAPDFRQWNPELEGLLRAPLAEIYERKAAAMFRRVHKKTGRLEIRGKADIPIEGSLELIRPEVLAALEVQLEELARHINRTTGTALDTAMKKVREAAAATNTPADLTAAVQEVFGLAEEWRARRIAITESSRAVHDSEVLAAAATGQVQGFKQILSEDACDICQFYDAQGKATGVPAHGYVGIGQAVEQLGDYGSELPPYHPNCRCGIVPVFVDEELPRVDVGDGWTRRAQPKPGAM